MTSVFPSLERDFDYSSCKGALVLLTGYASPQQLRRIGEPRLAQWLRRRRVRNYAAVATRALTAAHAQSVTLPGQDIAAAIITELPPTPWHWTNASPTSTLTSPRCSPRTLRPTSSSMPGFGPILGASLLVAAGDLAAFPSAGHLATAAGLVPVPNDSGWRTATYTNPAGTAGHCDTCSICPRKPA